jgi:hypothetical protein
MQNGPGHVDQVLGGETVLGEQVLGVSGSFGKGVLEADSAQGAAQAGLGQHLGYRGAQAADDRVVLGGDDCRGGRGNGEDGGSVQGLDDGNIHYYGDDTGSPQDAGRGESRRDHHAADK